MKSRPRTTSNHRPTPALTGRQRLHHVGWALLAWYAGLQVATQVFAHQLAYHGALGWHWGPFYAPWAIVRWGHAWHTVYPQQLMGAASVGMSLVVLGLLGIAIHKTILGNTAQAWIHLHGSARWAERADIEAAGLLTPRKTWRSRFTPTGKPQESGVYVGGWQDASGRFHYLRHAGPEHVLTYAPTRSGKGVGLVIPTLLSWPHSVLVTDLKGELWALTAGWRQRFAGNAVLRFEPAAVADSAHWNPLDEVRLGSAHEVGDVQNLATSIVDPDGKGLESHWQKTAFALLVGVMLHALYRAQQQGKVANLAMIDAMLADPSRPSKELWVEMATWQHSPQGAGNHPAVGAAARDMLDRAEEEAGSVLSTLKSHLSLYRDPVVAANVADSHFNLRSLMHHEKPVSLYIVTQPSDKARLRPLVRVLLNMAVRLLAERIDFEQGRPIAHYRHRLLMLFDEFPSLGRLPVLQESLAFLAGYGIKCYLICQDISQLKSRECGYGPDESITSNCHIQNAYPPNRLETAEHLSRLTGQTTVVKEQITTSGKRSSGVLAQVSRSFQEVQRPLLTADECLRMPGPRKNPAGDIEQAGDMLVVVAGYPAIYGRQPLYFQDPIFSQRSMVVAPPHSDRLCQPVVAVVL